MTELLEYAFETVRALPPETQDDLARILLQLADADQEIVDLTPDEEAAVLRSREAAARGEFATDEDLRALRARMKSTRDRHRTNYLRELRLVVPDARSPEVQRRLAEQVARLSRADEEEAMDWIESVSEFDEPVDDPPPSRSEDPRRA